MLTYTRGRFSRAWVDEILAPSFLSLFSRVSKGDLIVPLFGQKNKANGKEKKKKKSIANDDEDKDEDELQKKQKSHTLSLPPLSRCCCCSRFSSSRWFHRALGASSSGDAHPFFLSLNFFFCVRLRFTPFGQKCISKAPTRTYYQQQRQKRRNEPTEKKYPQTRRVLRISLCICVVLLFSNSVKRCWRRRRKWRFLFVVVEAKKKNFVFMF